MAFDGLSTDYQGVEGHGAAQILGPNKNIEILQDHLKTVADDLAKKRAAIAADNLGMDEKALGTAWEHDIPELAQGRNDLLNGWADFHKKYNGQPNLYGSPQYIDDQLKLKKSEQELMDRVHQSAQAKAANYEYTSEYAKNPDKYRPETQVELAKILAMSGEDKWNGKRSELLNKNPFVYNEDENAFLEKATKTIGSNTEQTDNGVTKTTTKNAVFDPKDPSKLTEWGKTVALPQAHASLQTQEGKRIIANMKRDNPGMTDEQATGEFTTRILNNLDKEYKKDVNLPPKEKEDSSKPKVDGSTVSYGNNVWTRRLLDDGTEMFTMSKKDATENKPLALTDAEGKLVIGLPMSMTRNSKAGEKSYVINVATLDADGNEVIKKVYYSDGNNADKIKNEYGGDPFKVRKDITGSLEIGEPGVGSVSNKGVSGPSSTTVKNKISEEDFNAKWAKLPPGGSLVGPDGVTYTKKKK